MTGKRKDGVWGASSILLPPWVCWAGTHGPLAPVFPAINRRLIMLTSERPKAEICWETQREFSTSSSSCNNWENVVLKAVFYYKNTKIKKERKYKQGDSFGTGSFRLLKTAIFIQTDTGHVKSQRGRFLAPRQKKTGDDHRPSTPGKSDKRFADLTVEPAFCTCVYSQRTKERTVVAKQVSYLFVHTWCKLPM